MAGPSALPIAPIAPRIKSVAHGVSTTRAHMAKRPNKPFGDSLRLRQMLEKPTWSVRSLMPREVREKDDAIKNGPRSAGFDNLMQRSTQRSSEQRHTGHERIQQLTPSRSSKEQQGQEQEQDVTSAKLRHLLRLAALPPPRNTEEEAHMLSDLRSQIHFVKEIQKVDTTGVKPLVAIRDETEVYKQESMVRLDDLKPWLEREDVVGRGVFRRIRRQRDDGGSERKGGVKGEVEEGQGGKKGGIEWDPFELGVGSEEGSGRKMGRYFVVKKAPKEAVEVDAPT